MRQQRKPVEGIRTRHAKGCRSRSGERCSCTPTFQASVWANRDQRRIFRTFATVAAAKAWRREAQTAIEAGTLGGGSRILLREAARVWLEGARAGTIRSRTGKAYKPSALRSYDRALRMRLLPAFGHRRLGDIQRRDVQKLVDSMLVEELDGSTIKNCLNPLQAIYRRAIQRDEVVVNPTKGLDLPRSEGRRERIASPSEAEALIAALPEEERALWSCALYAGLRRGELRALRWSDVDLATGVITVERGWDDKAGEIEGKTHAAHRTVPVAALLRDHLLAHKPTDAHDGFVFGRGPTRPFEPSTARRRALVAWKKANLKPIGLHEARHSFASLMIAAGVNAKALSSYMGHSSITTTFDLYGHLMPGNEAEAAGLLDAYLARASGGVVAAITPNQQARADAAASPSP